MKFGFTTGSCAAAASKAAAFMLLTGKTKNKIAIETPKGITFDADIVEIKKEEDSVTCAVVKDGGDDPDITTGALIFSTVCIVNDFEGAVGNYQKEKSGHNVIIDGGSGVGRVTKPGLDQPVGNAAINHVPRQMIEKEVAKVMELCDFTGTLAVTISVRDGEEIAKQTFNPRLGIEGGISILGTSGIVEPMSQKALLDTIKVELSQKLALGQKAVAVSPGNYGLDFMKRTYDFDLDKSVKCSNFIGDTIDFAIEFGFEKLLLTGHIGKLIKLSGGIMNTHSKEGDCRMELLAAAAIRKGATAQTAKAILDAVTTEEGISILEKEKILEPVMEFVMDKIMFFLNKRASGKLEIECMVYSNQNGLLAKSDHAEELLKEIKWYIS